MLLYEHRPARWPHAVAFLATLALVTIFVDLVILPEADLLPLKTEEEIDPVGQVVFGFFTLIGLFLLGVFGYRFVRNPWTFRLTDEGFEYNPAGVSSGFIRWDEVVEIKPVPVKMNFGGPRTLMVVGVVLKDPHSYVARHPAALGVLFDYRRYESGTPLVFQFREFGRDHDRVVALMQEQVARAAGRR